MAAQKGSYEAVFGHLGMTPDQLGNHMLALQERIDAAGKLLDEVEFTLADHPDAAVGNSRVHFAMHKAKAAAAALKG